MVVGDMRQSLRTESRHGYSGAASRIARVAYVEGALGGPDAVVSLAALFPHVEFSCVGPVWPDRVAAGIAALLVAAELDEVDQVVRRLENARQSAPVIVLLRDASVAATRRLMRAGAADILPAPAGEAALALSLERVLANGDATTAAGRGGQVIAWLKAGGGVGATALATQLASVLARRAGAASVCFTDLDLQFGLGALYLDLADAMTLTDILGGGGALEEAPLASAISRHGSGVRLLAAPREMTPLETLSPSDVVGLIGALRRDFAVTLIDLPTVWTAWTNEVLHLCDRIVLVTCLSVPHINLVQRQLAVIAAQGLDTVPLTLVCNQLNAGRQSLLSLKAAERAIGRAFDLAIPEDRKLMDEAVAQGRELSAIRAGSKLSKAIGELADALVPASVAPSAPRARFWS